MKTAKFWLSSIASILLVATTADANIIRLDARPSWGQYPIVGDTVSVDVYLDCECAGPPDDLSGYVAVQFHVLFDDQVYSYVPSLSLPNTLPHQLTGTEDPGVAAFYASFPPPLGSGNRALVVTGSTWGTPYGGSHLVPYYGYAASGGPHPIKPGTTNQVLIQYLSLSFAYFAGASGGGEWPLGTLVFRIQTLGSPALIGARMAPEDALVTMPLGDVLTTANGGVTTSGDFTIPAPEPARGTLLALGIATLPLLAWLRKPRRMR
jgi:hypothetical protein